MQHWRRYAANLSERLGKPVEKKKVLVIGGGFGGVFDLTSGKVKPVEI